MSDYMTALDHQPLDTLSVHDLGRLRTIIAEVIADGPWEFFAGADDTCGSYELEQRHEFTDKVLGRIISGAVGGGQ